MDAEFALAASAPFETPVAVVDERLMEENLRRMAALAAAAGIALRPHAKTHKSTHVAHRQLAHGAIGLTVATLTEAEMAARAGAGDILLAHPPVGDAKLRRLEKLAAAVNRLGVSVDDVEVARALPAAVDVLWEVDTGLRRLGTPPGEATVAQVHELLHHIEPARFRGLLTHGGHAYMAANDGARRQAAAEEAGGLRETAELLRASGVEVRELSVGSTPTAGHSGEQHGITELRPGTYVYGDANQVVLRSQLQEQCALGVVATVIGAYPDRVVVDAGSKAISADLRVPGLNGYGMVVANREPVLERLSEEHGVITGAPALRVGDRVVILPAHACTTVNLHPALLFAGDGQPRWVPVDARGWRSR